jgi:spore coat protein CotH
MSGNKNINRICVIITILAVLVTVLFMNGKALGIASIDTVSFDYEDKLFDDSYVHTIDIQIDDWDGFLETATSEEYSAADLIIDGEKVKNVGIRGKGNTSLSTVSQLGSQRYSLKIEFDAYQASGNYYGLDKLCLNNLIQDYTMMKDYIAYKLMNEFGADAPLVSYCFVTVNGEDWGLFLAVEAVEDSFLERNYGTNYGDLYKPDSMSMGGGRGNGGGFDMKDVDFDELGIDNPFERKNKDEAESSYESGGDGEMPSFPGGGNPFGGSDESSDSGDSSGSDGGNGGFSGPPGFGGSGGPGGGFGMGSDDVKLKYSDDDVDSYSTIFNNAKTEAQPSDKKRLINSLKSLSEGISEADSEKIASAVNVDEVLRYMVVHNFLVNGDSYTGSMIHNYYLYEEDGLMSMIPWDYNLAYGTFQASDSTGTVNDPIDTPLSITEGSTDRPMFSWITSTDEYLDAYHQYYQEFIDQFYTSGYLTNLVSSTYEMIHDYVDRDPTKFCTTEEFEKGVEAMTKFVTYRCESIQGQLDGTIPSTDSGQEADSSNLIDASDLTLSDMGSMGGGVGPGSGGGPGSSGGFGHRSGSDSDQQGHGSSDSGEDSLGEDSGSDSESGGSGPGSGGDNPFSGGGPGGFSGGPSGDNPFGGDSDGDNPFGGGADGDNPFGGQGNPFEGGSFSTVSTTDYIYLGVSAGAILLALLFASKFKRKRLG